MLYPLSYGGHTTESGDGVARGVDRGHDGRVVTTGDGDLLRVEVDLHSFDTIEGKNPLFDALLAVVTGHARN